MHPGRLAAIAALLLLTAMTGSVGAWAAEPTVGFNGWTNVPGVVEGAITVHPINTTLPKSLYGFVDYLPKGYNAADTTTRWPVLFVLNGAGEVGDGTDTDANGHQLRVKMTRNGPLADVSTLGWDFPCIVISPQAPGVWSNASAIKIMVDYVKTNYRADPTRLYMTGLSDGAAGTMRFVTAYPGLLAGIIPIEVTYLPTTTAETDAVKHLPMWVVHSFSDTVSRRTSIGWLNAATQGDTGLTSDVMAAYPGYGNTNSHYACATDASGLPLSHNGASTTVASAVVTNGSAVATLPAGNIIGTGSFYPSLFFGTDAAPFARVQFGADPASYVVKSVAASGITLTHAFTGTSQTADAHVVTPVGLVLSAYYQPATGGWTWPLASAQTPPPAGTPDNRVFTMFWQYDASVVWTSTYQNGQVWDWLFSRAPVTTPAQVALGSLATIYTGSPQAAAVTTTPSGLATTVTYNGSPTLPTNAGTYLVVAQIADPLYSGSASGAFNIAPANVSITLSGLTATYDGSAKTVTASTVPAGVNVNVVYAGGGAPVEPGSYPVLASSNSPNYLGTANGTVVIGKASGTITLGQLTAFADGSPKAVSATTTPAGLNVGITYNGASVAPSAIGSYTVAATIIDARYQGATSGTLTIASGTATVTLSALAATFDGNPHAAVATTAPAGLSTALTYNGSTTIPSAAGSYAVSASITAPGQNGSASGTLTIAPASAPVALSGLAAVFDGAAHGAVVTTTPAGLSFTITYDGAATAPSAVGPHAVSVTVTDPNYIGGTTGTLSISPAAATVTLAGLSAPFDGTAHAVTVTTTPPGLANTITYDGSAAPPATAGAHAVVATITDPSYVGSTSGTLNIVVPSEPTVGLNGWTNVPGVVEGTITTFPVNTTLPKPPLGFVAYFPKGYNQADTTTKWPVVVYLAGLGEAGDGTDTDANGHQLFGHMTTHGPLYQIMNFAWDFPAIIIAPQAAQNWNSTNMIKAEMDYIKANFRVDLKRLYMTGLCDGACGVLRYAATYPTDLAAILPIEAGALPLTGQGPAVKNLPMWIAHCFADPEVTARVCSIAWVDGATAADAGASDCMANYPGYGLSNRNHYACDVDPATGFPLYPNGPSTTFSNATVTNNSQLFSLGASVGSGIYLMWSSGSDAKPFATFTIPTGSANPDYWAKAGVMVRDSTDAGAKFAMVCQMPNNEVTMQWRDTTNGGADWVGVRVGGVGTVKFVKIVKTGTLFTGSFSNDNVTWTVIGSHNITFDNPTFTTGLEACAHNDGTTYTQTFTGLSVNGAVPAGLTDTDIGNPSSAGSGSFANGVYTVTGGGSDIWNNADQFNYDYVSASGDVTVSAKVGTINPVYNLLTCYPSTFYSTKKYTGPTATVPMIITTPIGVNNTGSFDPATGWTWTRDQHWDTTKPGKHIFTMFWYEDHVQGWRDTWGNTEVWNWLFSQAHP